MIKHTDSNKLAGYANNIANILSAVVCGTHFFLESLQLLLFLHKFFQAALHMNTHRGCNYNLAAGNFQLPIMNGTQRGCYDHHLNIWADKTIRNGEHRSKCRVSQCTFCFWPREDLRMASGDVSHSQVFFCVHVCAHGESFVGRHPLTCSSQWIMNHKQEWQSPSDRRRDIEKELRSALRSCMSQQSLHVSLHPLIACLSPFFCQIMRCFPSKHTNTHRGTQIEEGKTNTASSYLTRAVLMQGFGS